MGRVKVGLVLPSVLDRRVELVAAASGMSKSEVVEAALVLLLALIEHGVPDDLAYLLANTRTELLEKLQRMQQEASPYIKA
ncbi:MAG: hypothetical protein GSR84_03115 [Desulfurococcales archaeon]|nr:hypothetical protein [Desulfurococcales archaeon]